jgi:site-specific DNA-methyltransferase (adenine-specific)
MLNQSLFSSAKKDWETPQEFFDKLDAEFHFTMDVCATAQNTKCAEYFTSEMNGLSKSWSGRCWLNPPYGREIGAWVRKAYEESQRGILVVCLLPARTDTEWFQEWVLKANELRFIKGRLKFEGAQSSAPFPSCVAIFKGIL